MDHANDAEVAAEYRRLYQRKYGQARRHGWLRLRGPTTRLALRKQETAGPPGVHLVGGVEARLRR
jgi:hypothetical protein